MDRIAKAGLRYTQFHSTALCSPTRAALITGRNHHSVGSGVIGELATGYPGYDSVIGPDNATLVKFSGQRLCHVVVRQEPQTRPPTQYSLAGPYDQWPSGMGFDYFYGYMGGGNRSVDALFVSKIIPKFFRGSGIPATTSPPTWRMRPSSTCTC